MTINYKVFAAGDTLSANDLLTYIENQTVIQVDNEAELTTLHTTYPSVRVAFAQDTDKLYVKDDGVWEAVVSGVSPTLTNLTLTGNLTVQGATTTIDSTTIQVKDKFVFEGATADAHETTLQVTEPTADRTVTLPDATGQIVLRDTTDTLTNKTLTSPLVSGLLITDGSIVVEGATSDNFETTLAFTDPTADRTLTLPDASGTVALTSDIVAGAITASSTDTLTNKSISASTNTLTGVINNTLTTTTGDLIYASANNTPARLPIGSASQVLSVAGGIPSWATSTSGGMTHLQTLNLAGNSVTSNAFATTYKKILWVFYNLSMNGLTEMDVRVNGLSTTIYKNMYAEGTSFIFNDGSGSSSIVGSCWTGGSGQVHAGYGEIYNYGDTNSTHKHGFTTAVCTGSRHFSLTTFLITTSQAISTLTFHTSDPARQFDAGTVEIYGVN